jgi:uncharacterized membrane protein
MKLTPLTLSILTTTLVSGVAIALAWTGPSGSPFGTNTSAPINVGGIDQTKSGGMSSNGFISSGGLRVGLNTMLGSIGSSARSVLEVNGNIGTTAAYDAGYNWANINAHTYSAVSSIYSYGYICSGNASGACTGAGGVVIGPANTSASVNITNAGNTFFNVGNVGVGTNNPLAKLSVTGNIGLYSSAGTNAGAPVGGSIYLGDSNFYNTSYYNSAPGLSAVWDGSVAGSLAFYTYAGAANARNERMRILNTGNVGIGTTTPSQTLSVNGTIYSSAGGFKFPDGSTQTTAASGQWVTSGTNLYNANTGNVGIGATNPANAKLEVISAAGAVQMRIGDSGSATTNFDFSRNNTTGALSIQGNQVGNNNIVLAPSSGNVGISRTAPASKLEVGGNTVLFGTAGISYFSSGAANYIRGNTYFNGVLYDENNSAYYVDPASTSIYNDLRANIFYDNQNTGYYVDPNGTSVFSSVIEYGTHTINNASPTIYFQDTDGETAMIHNNSNLFYVLSGCGNNTVSWCTNGSEWPLVINLTNDATTIGGSLTVSDGGTFTVGGAANLNGGIADSAGTRMDSGGGWFRTYGSTGWYNGTHSVGMYATEAGYVTTYNNAGVKATSFVYYSDEKLKDNIKPLQSSLEKVRQLNGYTFNWKSNGRADIGVIAQEIEKVYPDLVQTDPEGIKSVEYGNLVAPLIEAIKELANNLDALATRVFNTESRQTELEKQNDILYKELKAIKEQNVDQQKQIDALLKNSKK